VSVHILNTASRTANASTLDAAPKATVAVTPEVARLILPPGTGEPGHRQPLRSRRRLSTTSIPAAVVAPERREMLGRSHAQRRVAPTTVMPRHAANRLVPRRSPTPGRAETPSLMVC
jgi:hypothetical protein